MIYFIWAKGTKFVKVGRTVSDSETSIGRRLEGLSAGCPHELQLIHALSLGSQYDDRLGEKQIHLSLTLAGRHVRGEWFRLPERRHSLRKIIERCLDKNIWRERRKIRRDNEQIAIRVSARALAVAGINAQDKRLMLSATRGVLVITKTSGPSCP